LVAVFFFAPFLFAPFEAARLPAGARFFAAAFLTDFFAAFTGARFGAG